MTIAYDYIWQGFQQEVRETITENILQIAFDQFNDWIENRKKYEDIKKRIWKEREQVYKSSNPIDKMNMFVQSLDSASHMLSLFSCLNSVINIIDNGKELLETRLKQFENIRKHAQTSLKGFEGYVKIEYREKLIPYLKEHLTNKKPKTLIPMLYALEQLNILETKLLSCHQTDLHKALKISFANIGSRSAFNSALLTYAPDPKKKKENPDRGMKIDQYESDINSFLRDTLIA